MTPKEKALELVHKYYIHSLKGKECALIAVNEMLDDASEELFAKKIKYWQEVKQEIENL